MVEAGCDFDGAVLGGGGTLDLDTGVGTLTGLLAGGNVTVSGQHGGDDLQNFATVEIGAAATFTTSGAVTIAAGQAVIDDGSLTLGRSKTTVTNAGLIEADGGSLTIKGAVNNTGVLAAGGGTLTVNGAVTGRARRRSTAGRSIWPPASPRTSPSSGTTGVLELAQSQTYTKTITGFSKTGGTFLDLDDIAFVGAGEATYSGTKTGGVLTVTDGTHTAHINLKGDYRTSTFVAASDGHGGTIVHDPASPAALPPWIVPGAGQRFIAAMAGLVGCF